MDNIETAVVISDVGVSERNNFSLLQRHLKVKLNGKQVFFLKDPSPPLILCLKERK